MNKKSSLSGLLYNNSRICTHSVKSTRFFFYKMAECCPITYQQSFPRAHDNEVGLTVILKIFDLLGERKYKIYNMTTCQGCYLTSIVTSLLTLWIPMTVNKQQPHIECGNVFVHSK